MSRQSVKTVGELREIIHTFFRNHPDIPISRPADMDSPEEWLQQVSLSFNHFLCNNPEHGLAQEIYQHAREIVIHFPRNTKDEEGCYEDPVSLEKIHLLKKDTYFASTTGYLFDRTGAKSVFTTNPPSFMRILISRLEAEHLRKFIKPTLQELATKVPAAGAAAVEEQPNRPASVTSLQPSLFSNTSPHAVAASGQTQLNELIATLENYLTHETDEEKKAKAKYLRNCLISYRGIRFATFCLSDVKRLIEAALSQIPETAGGNELRDYHVTARDILTRIIEEITAPHSTVSRSL